VIDTKDVIREMRVLRSCLHRRKSTCEDRALFFEEWEIYSQTLGITAGSSALWGRRYVVLIFEEEM